jgi:anti-anti-sigma factor
VAALRGELDIVDADNVAAELTALTVRGGCLIVDMSALCFIDCSALGALLGVERQARKSGVEVVLAAPQDVVARILALTGMGEVFRVYASVQDAVASNADRSSRHAGAGRAERGTLTKGSVLRAG